jgi:hypothetical protein
MSRVPAALLNSVLGYGTGVGSDEQHEFHDDASEDEEV